MSPSDSPAVDVFLGRQPILDRQQGLLGYELLFRSSQENRADVSSPSEATADVVCKAFAELGLADALGNHIGFVNVGKDLLFSDAIELLPAHAVTLEVSANLLLQADVQERCQVLKEKGYSFCITQVEKAMEAMTALTSIARYVKVDTDVLSGPALEATASLLKGTSARLMASRVESLQTMQLCESLGFDYYQGYYFAHPVVIEGRKLDSSAAGLLRLVNLLNSDAELPELETAFKGEPGLTVNLLRLVNSVGAGVTVKVTSIRHAITVMGRRQLLRWLQLLIFSSGNNKAGLSHNPLMQHAALRGYFMEQLSQSCYPGRKDLKEQAFLTGLMSLIPAALGLPVEEILEKIAVVGEVRAALLQQQGELGFLLALTERYDANDMPGTANLLARLGGAVTFRHLGECLSDTISWVQKLAADNGD
ncbi:MAG: EAL domain-containing protein [Rhodocyclaceae bacterium]|nr:MAG: EAL domain-containing protein [Rhodocyclaceae bacterium]